MTDVAPEVSVLLSVWNGMPHLRRSVDSVLGQLGASFELLVVDDGSTDGSADFVARLADPRVRVLQAPPRSGLYPNLNRMLAASRAPLVRVWAQDDVMLPDCLASVVDFHRRHAEVVVAYCAAAVLDDAERWRSIPDDHTPEILPPDRAAWYILLHGSLCGNVSTLSARTSLLIDAGGFPQHIAGDFDLIERASIAAPLGHIRAPGVAIRVHDGQWSRKPGSDVEILRHSAMVWRAVLTRVGARCAECPPRRARALLAEGIARVHGGAVLRAMLAGRWGDVGRLARDYEGVVRWYEWPWHDLRRRLGLRRRLA